MKVKISRKDAVSLAKTAMDVMGVRNSNPVFTRLILRADIARCSLVLTCGSGGIALATRFVAEVIEEGEAVVSGSVFAKIVKALPNNDEVTLETFAGPMQDLVIADEKLQIICGRSKTAIKVYESSEGPGGYVADMMSSFEEGREIVAGHFEAGQVSSACKYVSAAAARKADDESYKRLENICMDFTDDGSLSFVGSDGRRLAHATVNAVEGSESVVGKLRQISVPCSAIDALIDMCDKYQPLDELTFKSDGSRLIVQHQLWMLSLALSSLPYSNYKPVIELKDGYREILMPKVEFSNTLHRALLLDMEEAVYFEMHGSVASMEVRKGDNLSHDDFDFDASVPVEPFSTCVRGRFLMDAVTDLPQETFMLHYKDGVSPMHITCGNVHYVVMPIRPKE